MRYVMRRILGADEGNGKDRSDGIDFVWEEGRRLIGAQLQTASDLDAKVSPLIALTAALTALLFGQRDNLGITASGLRSLRGECGFAASERALSPLGGRWDDLVVGTAVVVALARI